MTIPNATEFFRVCAPSAGPSGKGSTGVCIAARSWGQLGGTGLCVLVHGFLAHAGWWAHIAPSLTRFREVVALDLSGMGDSDHRATYKISDHVDEITCLIAARRLAGEPITLVGHSFGGGVCLALVDSHPELIQELIVIDSIMRFQPRPFEPNKGFSGRTYASAEEALARFRLIPDQPVIRPELTTPIAREALTELSSGRWAWKFDASRPLATETANNMWNASVERYQQFRGRKRFIRGELSLLFTAEQQVELEKYLDQPGHVETVAGAHHHVLLDQPEALIRRLNQNSLG